MSEDVASKARLTIRPTKVQTTHGSGSELKALGVAKVRFLVKIFFFKEGFIITEGLPIDALLGVNFMKTHVPCI